MGIVGTGFTTSLNGFIARPNGDVGPLFDWYFGGDTEYTVPSSENPMDVPVFVHRNREYPAWGRGCCAAAPAVTE